MRTHQRKELAHGPETDPRLAGKRHAEAACERTWSGRSNAADNAAEDVLALDLEWLQRVPVGAESIELLLQPALPVVKVQQA